jgi:predicted alpha/beta superfamily hydrolase
MVSRRRDYTPTPNGPSDAPAGARHGESAAYQRYLRDTVLPYVDAKWRTLPGKRVYVGHSYGGLLGAQILLTEPELFSGYILGSPSFWFDKRHFLNATPGLLARRAAINAKVFLYIGGYEALLVGDRRYHQEVDMVADNKAFAAMLSAKAYPGLQLKSAVMPEENHFSIAPRGFTQGLLHVLPAADR